MKAASHELKGAIHYNTACRQLASERDLLDIRVPMQALVDYRGFRLVARPLLPLSKDSIVYGSSDAGGSFHCDNAAFNDVSLWQSRKAGWSEADALLRPLSLHVDHASVWPSASHQAACRLRRAPLGDAGGCRRR
jgi:hypothetical protein